MSSNGLAVREQGAPLALSGSVQINSLGEVFRLAERLAQARGFVPSHLLGNPNGIAAAILTGIELGMGAMEAMRSLHIVEGKPTMAADVMLARAIRAGVRHTWERSDGEEARLKLERPGFAPYVQRWTIVDAKAAGLAGKGNWSKYGPAMLRARCVSAAMRAFCPDVLGSGVYVEGEIEAREEERMPAPSIAAAVAEEAARIVETAAAPLEELAENYVRTPETFDDCRDADELRAFCGDRRFRRLVNGKRGVAQAKAREAADRCGVSHEEALAWAGLDEAEAAQ